MCVGIWWVKKGLCASDVHVEGSRLKPYTTGDEGVVCARGMSHVVTLREALQVG